jgi:hypothetical protein
VKVEMTGKQDPLQAVICARASLARSCVGNFDFGNSIATTLGYFDSGIIFFTSFSGT